MNLDELAKHLSRPERIGREAELVAHCTPGHAGEEHG